tara:strand:+ start:125 stop:538 length:414 start_codon:yes stop_codon:yes gene_type:complete
MKKHILFNLIFSFILTLLVVYGPMSSEPQFDVFEFVVRVLFIGPIFFIIFFFTFRFFTKRKDKGESQEVGKKGKNKLIFILGIPLAIVFIWVLWFYGLTTTTENCYALWKGGTESDTKLFNRCKKNGFIRVYRWEID